MISRAQEWRLRRRRTATLVKASWKAIARKRWGPEEVEGLMRLTWVKSGTQSEYNNPRRTTWLAFQKLFGASVSEQVRWPVTADYLESVGVPRSIARLATDEVGIVGLRPSWWPEVEPWIRRNWRSVRGIVVDAAVLPAGDLPRVRLAERIGRLPKIPLSGDESRGAHPREVLTPLIACLDRGNRFPIVNYARRNFLKALQIGDWEFHDQVKALLALVPWRAVQLDSGVDVDDWTLDSNPKWCEEARSRIRRATSGFRRANLQRLADETIEVRTSSQRRSYRSAHRRLTNALQELLGDRAKRPWKSDPQFDVLVHPEKPGGFYVLIEVKPDLANRESLRLAIGQLFEYRHELDKHAQKNLKLAVVCGPRPPDSALELLIALGIDVAWFVDEEFVKLEGVGRSLRWLGGELAD